MAREQWRTEIGKLQIPVPGSQGLVLSVVEDYKHLGTYCSVKGETYRNTQHRVQEAMAAYAAPIAVK
eukprot:1552309-Karenia_brevis.AAC.1